MKKLFSYTLRFLIIAAYVFYNTSCTKDQDNGPVISGDISFSKDIQPIFTSNCIGCHFGDSPVGSTNLEDGKSYTNIVDVISFGYAPALRVKPSSADSSVLWNKDAGTGTYGMQMPPGGSLQQSEMDIIKKWIDQGAKNN